MCHIAKVRHPELVLAEGVHAGFEWLVIHNNMGTRCGYVKVEPGHPWHGKGYDGVEADVHGGLTFAEADVDCGKGDDNGWWLGFDCAHSCDAADPELPMRERATILSMFSRGKIRTQEYVEAECRSLCEQALRAQ